MKRSQLKKHAHNSLVDQKTYHELIFNNPDFYCFERDGIKEDDVDLMAFLGMPNKNVPDNYSPPPRVIPIGDVIVGSFTVGDYDYFRTHSGYFYKKHQSKNIKPLEEKVFWSLMPERESFNFCSRLGSTQAGLTRGSKRSFFDRAETQKNKLLEIQNKYKDGVK